MNKKQITNTATNCASQKKNELTHHTIAYEFQFAIMQVLFYIPASGILLEILMNFKSVNNLDVKYVNSPNPSNTACS